mmetsp:Transcript_576/g.672  ORF Transcript_576/g.672 Transcript_576/m.672 type:complete len:213 (+) Transcript_576:120-758(+)
MAHVAIFRNARLSMLSNTRFFPREASVQLVSNKVYGRGQRHLASWGRKQKLQHRSIAVRRFCTNIPKDSGNIVEPSGTLKLADVLIRIGCGLGLGYTLAGTVDFVFEFPEPLAITWKLCQENSEISEVFGKPLSKSYLWDGSVTEYQASVTLPISGSKGNGSLVGRLIKDKHGQWIPLLVVARKDKKLVTIVDTSRKPRKLEIERKTSAKKS